jgi:hypothetical protein
VCVACGIATHVPEVAAVWEQPADVPAPRKFAALRNKDCVHRVMTPRQQARLAVHKLHARLQCVAVLSHSTEARSQHTEARL